MAIRGAQSEMFPVVLKGSFWHTTSLERYLQIRETEAILPNPGITDSERWGTGAGEKHFPFVRTLGGVSLFDFVHFDPVSYSEKYPVSQWRSFVPTCTKWDVSVWLEVDVLSLGENFVSGSDLLARWKNEAAYGHNIMPVIEAACLAPISLSSITRTLKMRKEGEFEEVNS